MENVKQLAKLFEDEALKNAFAEKAKGCTDQEQVINLLIDTAAENGITVTKEEIMEAEEKLRAVPDDELEAVAGGDLEKGLELLGFSTVIGLVFTCVAMVGEITAAFFD